MGSRNVWLCVSGPTQSPERIGLNLELALSWGAGGGRGRQGALTHPHLLHLTKATLIGCTCV